MLNSGVGAVADQRRKAAFVNQVHKRLEQYGFGERMSPQKNQAYQSIRQVISMRMQPEELGKYRMSDDLYVKAAALLDELLPDRPNKSK